jgi:transposase
MPRRLDARATAMSLWEGGTRNASFAAKLANVKVRTMQSYFNKLRRGESLEDKARSGRPRKLNSTLRRQLGQIKAKHPDEDSLFYAQELSLVSGQAISERTVRRALKMARYRYRLSAKKQLTRAQKAERLQFAQARLKDSWETVGAADECTFNLRRHGNRRWVRVRTDDAQDEPAPAKLTDAQNAVSISVVAVIFRGRKSALGFLPKNWDSTDLATVFERDVYPSLLWKSRGRNKNTLMWDNDGRHHAAPWREAEARMGVEPIRPWPANSPDFNPIENTWAWMKRNVERKAPRTEQALRQAIVEAWQAFPAEDTVTLLESLPRRLQLAIRRKGGRTGY